MTKNTFSKNTNLFVIVFMSAVFASVGQEMSFEEYNPKSTLIVPGKEIKQAKFPFIDVHSHQRDMSVGKLTSLLKDMESLNEGIMVNLSGGSGASLKTKVDNINKSFPNRFVVFANVDFSNVDGPDWGERAALQLEQDIKNGAKGLKIFKSLGLRYKDAKGERLAIDDTRLDPIWAKCAEMGVPVLIHAADPKSFWDDMNSDNERWLELKTHPRCGYCRRNCGAWKTTTKRTRFFYKISG